jgi:hypothetical protein
MLSRSLNETLTDLHDHEPGLPGEHRSALETELLSHHRQLYPRKEGWRMMINPRWRMGRLVLGGLAVLVLGIAACTIPTSYEADVGKSLTFAATGDPAGLPDHGELLSFLQEAAVAEDVSVSLSESSGGPATYNILLWGDRVPQDDLVQMLRRRFAGLSSAQYEVRELEGQVRGSLAEKIGHDLFRIEVEGDDLEEIRAQILAGLATQGFQGEAAVNVSEENGLKEIQIQLSGQSE